MRGVLLMASLPTTTQTVGDWRLTSQPHIHQLTPCNRESAGRRTRSLPRGVGGWARNKSIKEKWGRHNLWRKLISFHYWFIILQLITSNAAKWKKTTGCQSFTQKGERKIWGILFGRKYFLMSLYKMNQKFHYLLFNYITHAFLHA